MPFRHKMCSPILKGVDRGKGALLFGWNCRWSGAGNVLLKHPFEQWQLHSYHQEPCSNACGKAFCRVENESDGKIHASLFTHCYLLYQEARFSLIWTLGCIITLNETFFPLAWSLDGDAIIKAVWVVFLLFRQRRGKRRMVVSFQQKDMPCLPLITDHTSNKEVCRKCFCLYRVFCQTTSPEPRALAGANHVQDPQGARRGL